jgi:hypothetical protein
MNDRTIITCHQTGFVTHGITKQHNMIMFKFIYILRRMFLASSCNGRYYTQIQF